MIRIAAIAVVFGVIGFAAEACNPESPFPQMLTEAKTLITARIVDVGSVEGVEGFFGAGLGRAGRATILVLQTEATHRGEIKETWHVLYRGVISPDVFSELRAGSILAALNPPGVLNFGSDRKFGGVRDQRGRLLEEVYETGCSGPGLLPLDVLAGESLDASWMLKPCQLAGRRECDPSLKQIWDDQIKYSRDVRDLLARIFGSAN